MKFHSIGFIDGVEVFAKDGDYYRTARNKLESLQGKNKISPNKSPKGFDELFKGFRK